MIDWSMQADAEFDPVGQSLKPGSNDCESRVIWRVQAKARRVVLSGRAEKSGNSGNFGNLRSPGFVETLPTSRMPLIWRILGNFVNLRNSWRALLTLKNFQSLMALVNVIE
ncbi:hypothetical protein K0M31_013199 [Melipona bicolor]|uniref:Uncharacterized protein n=1 Tax=Melipona bicolor TaxID=60889 RepID=A0AA40FIM5_9HYME|nr:hypothetical protein K0M31_013199 [Melipona bicolor]